MAVGIFVSNIGIFTYMKCFSSWEIISKQVTQQAQDVVPMLV